MRAVTIFPQVVFRLRDPRRDRKQGQYEFRAKTSSESKGRKKHANPGGFDVLCHGASLQRLTIRGIHAPGRLCSMHRHMPVARADQCSNKFDFIAKNVDFPEENKNGDIERFLLYYVT